MYTLYTCMSSNTFSKLLMIFLAYQTFVFYIGKCIDIFLYGIIRCFYILKYFSLKIKYSPMSSSSYFI